jgi:peptide/nickel transport system ATP-binding protein
MAGHVPVLEVRDLVTCFSLSKTVDVRAVNGVSFAVQRGKVLGLVGESGSGKSVTGFSIMGLVSRPGYVASGRILFDGEDITGLPNAAMRTLRGRRIAMVFQDPMMTLNPVLRIGTQMIEALQAHERIGRDEARQRCRDALGRVGIPSPNERLKSYPHELSGGMRQRVAIAIALLHRPDLIIADEPTTALDVTVQAQIIAQFQKLTDEREMAVIWITHDLAVVSRLADEIAVMYAGRIVEQGDVREVLTAPRHPYTEGLIRSVPSNNARGRPLRQIPGLPPGRTRLPHGCSFRTRCGYASEACQVEPATFEEGGRRYRCFNPLNCGGAA